MKLTNQFVVVALAGVLAGGCTKKDEAAKQEPPKAEGSGNAMASGSAAGSGTVTGSGTGDTGSAAGAGSGSAVAKQPETPLPTDGVQVTDVKNYSKAVRAEFTGLYDKAIAYRSAVEIDKMFILVARDCPKLDCKTIEDSKGDVEKKAAKTCPKGVGLILNTEIQGVDFKDKVAKPGQHLARVVLQDMSKDQEFEYLNGNARDVPFTITEISDTVVSGTIRYEAPRGGSVLGTFKATMCKPPKV